MRCDEFEGELRGALLYRRGLYEAGTVERLAGRLVRVLEGAAGDAGRRLSEIRMLTEEEAGVGGPERFGKVKLSRKELEDLIMEIGDSA